MRALLAPLFSLALLAACEPLADPAAPSAENKPCQSDADCEMHTTDGSAHQALCGSRVTTMSDKTRDMDTAACGPMANMTPKMPEPVLACFHGTCVSVGSKR